MAHEMNMFYIAGKYIYKDGIEVMQGAMYVEHWRPQESTQKYPIILFHGAGQTSSNWLTTPDGRKGWAQYFNEQGYEVYLVDQPARGRSAWHPDLDGKLRCLPTQFVEVLFTACSELGAWPQAKLHTQWPGDGANKGRKGDPVFDQFYASQVEYLESNAETQTLVKAAGCSLLDRVGPAILLTHSQAGPFGWLLADARPKLVKAVLAIEPNGPPMESTPITGSRHQLRWGVTDIPITYSPAISDAGELNIEKQVAPDQVDLLPFWQQKAPARELPNLQGIPILILTAEASYHAQYDHAISHWLTQAGVSNEMVRLEDVGIAGNGHMLMLEKNNFEVASVIHDWVLKNVA
jgi:pimeloyl-ACP methyl ester carboxylesterase